MTVKVLFLSPNAVSISIAIIKIIACIFLILGCNSLRKKHPDYLFTNLFKIIGIINIIGVISIEVLILINFYTWEYYIIYVLILVIFSAIIKIITFGIMIAWIGLKNKKNFGKYLLISGFMMAISLSFRLGIYLYYWFILVRLIGIDLYVILMIFDLINLVSYILFSIFAIKILVNNLKVTAGILIILEIFLILRRIMLIYYLMAYAI